MRKALIAIIKIYQKIGSPFLGKNCKYYPTCSHYAIESIEKHGSLKGSALAAWRILRCNPFSAGGYDPVIDNSDYRIQDTAQPINRRR